MPKYQNPGFDKAAYWKQRGGVKTMPAPKGKTVDVDFKRPLRGQPDVVTVNPLVRHLPDPEYQKPVSRKAKLKRGRRYIRMLRREVAAQEAANA